jgi:hypothetical protein
MTEVAAKLENSDTYIEGGLLLLAAAALAFFIYKKSDKNMTTIAPEGTMMASTVSPSANEEIDTLEIIPPPKSQPVAEPPKITESGLNSSDAPKPPPPTESPGFEGEFITEEPKSGK